MLSTASFRRIDESPGEVGNAGRQPYLRCMCLHSLARTEAASRTNYYRTIRTGPGSEPFIFEHCSTVSISAAPTVDVLANAAVLVDNAQYSNITPYLSVPPSAYALEITPGNNNAVIVASFAANLSSLGGGAAVVLASGFLNPSTNQSGPAFGLIGVLADGTVIIFGNTTGIEESNVSDFVMYPNPANDLVKINFAENTRLRSTVTINDALGRVVKSEIISSGSANHQINIGELNKGIYFVKIDSESGSTNQKLIVE